MVLKKRVRHYKVTLSTQIDFIINNQSIELYQEQGEGQRINYSSTTIMML